MTDQIVSSRTGLLIFDLYEGARPTVVARGMSLKPTLRLMAHCHSVGVPRFFTRPVHRPDGKDFARTIPDMDRDHQPYGPDHSYRTYPGGATAGSPESIPLKEFNVGPEDYDITKHRWSAFHGTGLDLSLRTAHIDTLLIIGGTTHIGVASTVYAGRDLDYQLVVVRDCCHGTPVELASLLDDIFPQVCHVRTVDQIIAVLR